MHQGQCHRGPHTPADPRLVQQLLQRERRDGRVGRGVVGETEEEEAGCGDTGGLTKFDDGTLEPVVEEEAWSHDKTHDHLPGDAKHHENEEGNDAVGHKLYADGRYRAQDEKVQRHVAEVQDGLRVDLVHLPRPLHHHLEDNPAEHAQREGRERSEDPLCLEGLRRSHVKRHQQRLRRVPEGDRGEDGAQMVGEVVDRRGLHDLNARRRTFLLGAVRGDERPAHVRLVCTAQTVRLSCVCERVLHVAPRNLIVALLVHGKRPGVSGPHQIDRRRLRRHLEPPIPVDEPHTDYQPGHQPHRGARLRVLHALLPPRRLEALFHVRRGPVPALEPDRQDHPEQVLLRLHCVAAQQRPDRQPHRVLTPREDLPVRELQRAEPPHDLHVRDPLPDEEAGEHHVQAQRRHPAPPLVQRVQRRQRRRVPCREDRSQHAEKRTRQRAAHDRRRQEEPPKRRNLLAQQHTGHEKLRQQTNGEKGAHALRQLRREEVRLEHRHADPARRRAGEEGDEEPEGTAAAAPPLVLCSAHLFFHRRILDVGRRRRRLLRLRGQPQEQRHLVLVGGAREAVLEPVQLPLLKRVLAVRQVPILQALLPHGNAGVPTQRLHELVQLPPVPPRLKPETQDGGPFAVGGAGCCRRRAGDCSTLIAAAAAAAASGGSSREKRRGVLTEKQRLGVELHSFSALSSPSRVFSLLFTLWVFFFKIYIVFLKGGNSRREACAKKGGATGNTCVPGSGHATESMWGGGGGGGQ
eukprot:Rhum_TRINITY_DN7257_c0_g1::Rhum_TRINITY_DN7257_c0_g1_i1::g.22347::m.22347